MPRLTAANLPVPVSIDLLPGVTTYRAPSGAGKTTAMRAYFALMLGTDEWGKPAKLPEGATVEMAFGATVLHLGKRRQWGDVVCRSMAEWREQAKDWRSVDPGRLLLVSAPHGDRLAWYASLSPAELRDLLIAAFSDIPLDGGRPALTRATSSLCEATVKASEFFLDGDPTDPKRIDERRLDAQKAEERAHGALEQARVALQALAPPLPVDAVASRAVVAAFDEWTAYIARREAWQAARDLGERGTRPTGAAIDTAREILAGAARDAEHAAAAESGAAALLTQAERWTPPGEPEDLRDLRSRVRVLEQENAKPHPFFVGACADCEHGGAAQRAEIVRLQADLTTARTALEARSSEWATELDETKTRAGLLEAQAREAFRLAEAKTDAADQVRDNARRALADLEAQAASWTRWGEKRDLQVAQSGLTQNAWSALVSGPEPVAPTSTQPSVKAAEAARQALVDIERAEVVSADREARREQAQAQVDTAEAKWIACQAKTERLRELLKVAREAPRTLLPRTIAAIEATGMLGPVSLSETAEGVEVLWKGRPWWTASDGERVYGDVCLRAALRAALEMPSVYLWVDRAQDWSPPRGETWPASRVVLLDTGSK